MNFLRNIRRADACALLRRAILAWLTAAAARYLLLPRENRKLEALSSLEGASFGKFLLGFAAIFALLTLLSGFFDTKKAERFALPCVFALYAAVALFASFSAGLLGACVVLFAILGAFALRGAKCAPEILTPHRKKAPWAKAAVALLALAFCAYVGAWTVARVKSYGTPSYDFGLFAQMFHNMKTTLKPMTTLERDGLLSHFAVHFSPIYYLLLPFYALCPKPETLQVLQALLLASAVIPLWLICRRRGLSPLISALVCAMLLAYPALAGGTSYDLHENAFLTPLLLWLFYAIDAKKHGVLALSAVLTLLVKEDAAVYVAVIGLWLLLRGLVQGKNRSDLLRGAALFLGALIYFGFVTALLSAEGEGVMNWRYNNMIYDGSGSLTAVVKAVLLNPVKALAECFEADKLTYLAQTMLPLALLPLFTRRYERFVLLIPYFLVNLLADYTYQHSVMFQYNFGSLACLFYLTVVNLSELRFPRVRVGACALALVAAVAVFTAQVAPSAQYYFTRYASGKEIYAQTDAFLAQIPEEASVTATTFLTTRLSGREVLYDYQYCSEEHLLESEYVVLGYAKEYKIYSGGRKTHSFEEACAYLEARGYTLWAELENRVLIFKK